MSTSRATFFICMFLGFTFAGLMGMAAVHLKGLELTHDRIGLLAFCGSMAFLGMVGWLDAISSDRQYKRPRSLPKGIYRAPTVTRFPQGYEHL